MSAADHRAAARQWRPQEIFSDSISGLHYPAATLPCSIMGHGKERRGLGFIIPLSPPHSDREGKVQVDSVAAGSRGTDEGVL